MIYEFAPLEGITDSIYRRLHHVFFPGIHRYYTPFFSPTVHRALTPKEERELPYADTLGYCAVPQLLTKNAEDFLWMTRVCRDRGYETVNLNLGCPSGTVVSKGKGSGMLADLAFLNSFLDQVFTKSVLRVSVKTRIGLTDPEEFLALLEIFNRYPLEALILHPRLRKDFYAGPIRWDAVDYALSASKNPVVFNGNLCSIAQISDFSRRYPQVNCVMIGRGLVGDPGMLCPGGTDRKKLEDFCSALLEEYLIAFGGSRNAMFRLKENWRYLLCRFDGVDRLGKKLRKTTDLAEFRQITTEILRNLPMKQALEADW